MTVLELYRRLLSLGTQVCVTIGHGYRCFLFRNGGWDRHFWIFKMRSPNYIRKHALKQCELMQYDPLHFMFFLYNLQFLKSEHHLIEEVFSECSYNCPPVPIMIWVWNNPQWQMYNLQCSFSPQLWFPLLTNFNIRSLFLAGWKYASTNHFSEEQRDAGSASFLSPNPLCLFIR